MRKIVTTILIALLLIAMAFQIYFDLQLRNFNGAVANEIVIHRNFFQAEFPKEIQDFNSKQKQ